MLNRLIFLLLLQTSSITLSNMSPAGFERFHNHYFVETGTYKGKGIQLALGARFPEIYSIEINPKLVFDAKKRFASNMNVHIILGDSGCDLWDIIKDLSKPITFWLDGHLGVPRPDGGKNTSLLEELSQIKMHPIKNHTILIDDMHCCNTLLFDGLSKSDIERKILEINPHYTISFIDGGERGEHKNNIMVAQVFEE